MEVKPKLKLVRSVLLVLTSDAPLSYDYREADRYFPVTIMALFGHVNEPTCGGWAEHTVYTKV